MTFFHLNGLVSHLEICSHASTLFTIRIHIDAYRSSWRYCELLIDSSFSTGVDFHIIKLDPSLKRHIRSKLAGDLPIILFAVGNVYPSCFIWLYSWHDLCSFLLVI
jgi:hypothetical protein